MSEIEDNTVPYKLVKNKLVVLRAPIDFTLAQLEKITELLSGKPSKKAK